MFLSFYAGLAVCGWPQRATEAVAAASSHAEASHPAEDASSAAHPEEAGASASEWHAAPAKNDDPHVAPSGDSSAPAAQPLPHLVIVVPFVLLLACIAILPLTPGVSHWWESNLHRFLVAAGLGLVVAVYYAYFYGQPLDGHFPAHYVAQPAPQGISVQVVTALLKNALISEFFPFIVLLFSLYTICGGIRVEGNLRPTPFVNAAIIAAGMLLASFLGTTGAAMLAIRPLLETNQRRKYVAHTVVFFIFGVCNCGGLLTPLGDPPLFLGYLAGVPFLWTFRLIGPWLVANGLILLAYLLADGLFFYRREDEHVKAVEAKEKARLTMLGLSLNGPLLLGVVLAVAFLDPSKPIPGINVRSWVFLREAAQLAMVALSLAWGARSIRAANRFHFAAIVEVAALFVGIFITMQPVLQILKVHGPQLGLNSPKSFYWVTGGLSAVLDNAPTYMVFLETARSLPPSGKFGPDVAGAPEQLLIAISLGAVFMGAMTYIGNGPNFMVKAVAESVGVKMPSFFGYVIYSVCVLLPIFFLVQYLFL